MLKEKLELCVIKIYIYIHVKLIICFFTFKYT